MNTDRSLITGRGIPMRAGREIQKPKRNYRTFRILLVLILVLIIAIAGAAAYSYKSAKDSLDISFTEKTPQVEAGGEYAAMDFVKDSEGEVTPSGEFLSADKTGSKEIVYTVSKPVLGGLMTASEDYTLTYNVVDTVAPLILWNGNGSVLQRYEKFDINDVIGYGDNADPEPSIEVEGEVKMTRTGKYPLHVKITDVSGNSTEADLTVEVADSVPVYTDNSPRTQFADFVSEHKGSGRSFGIDVSTWQGDVDFDAVKKAGCEFVIIRIGYSVDGKIEKDSKFEQNYENARAAGLKTGVYLYSYDNTGKEVRASADQIEEILGEEKPDLPVVFDWEDFGQFQTYKMSFAGLNDLYDAFADQLSSAGYECMLYGNKNSLEKVWEDTDTRPVWLAHYTDKTDYKGPYVMWQASQTGNIDGIDGDVDMDILYK